MVVAKSKAKAAAPDALVGKWFHSYEGNDIEWQGQVTSALGDGDYLVQVYDWLIGASSAQHVVPRSEMRARPGQRAWTFYDTSEEMNSHYERYERSKTHSKKGHANV